MTGHMTNQNGIVHFHGNYLTFIIQFETDGFSKISRIPTSEITNKIIVANDIFGNVTSNLYEQLINVSDINTMTKISDTFLLSLLNRQKNSHQLPDSISYISNQINRTREFLRIRDYAYRSNMSLRNFERRFLEHTGLSPTNYIQLLRFNNVLKTKLTNPFLSWAAIAADCGYYDQMHMIRDFKRFSNLSPTAYFENDEKFERPSINIFDSDGVTLGKLQSNLPKEYFIFIERQGI